MSRTLALLFALAAVPVSASADTLPVDQRVTLGRPARPAQVHVEATPESIQIRVTGRGELTHELPLPGASQATVTQIQLAGGAGLVLIVAESDQRRSAALITADRGVPRSVWNGRLDPHGDAGERRADVIRIADETGDGVDDVIVGITLESHRICGDNTAPLLSPRAVEPTSLTLQPISLRRLDTNAEEESVAASADSPGPTESPVLRNAAFTIASSSPGSGPDEATAQVNLHDGDPATMWLEGRPQSGRWEFVTAQLHAARHPVRAIALTLPADRAGVAAPHHLWLVGDHGPRLRVEIPAALATPGNRVWVAPAAPRAWRCLSVVLDDAHDAAARPHVGLAEVEVYTEIDFGGGIDVLIEELVADGEGGADAARLLANLGPPAVALLATHWETLTPLGKRRGVSVLGPNAPDSAEARELLLRATTDAEADVRSDALMALADAGPVAYPGLAAIAGDEGPSAAEAALLLARRGGQAAVEPLLSAISTERGAERPALRRALSVAVERGGDEALSHARRWTEASPATAAAAAVALALSTSPHGRPLASRLLIDLLPRVERFEDRWRFVRAAGRLPSQAPIDDRLENWARHSEEWMLRRAALEALADRDRDRARDIARTAIDDPYPRVRVAALPLLANRRDAAAVRERATDDSWPMVRAAAITALTRDPAARDLVRGGLDDDAQLVRASAVRALIQRRDRGASPAIGARLLDDDEWPEVLSAAIAYARVLCRPELAEALVEVVKRGLRPDPWAPDIDLAVEAVDALGILGGADADRGIRRAATEFAPVSLREAAARAQRAERCRP